MVCLAAIVYVWPSVAPVIVGWWMVALIGVCVKTIDPTHGKSSAHQIITDRYTWPLSAWVGLWNGFYVWKDLDHDYRRRNRRRLLRLFRRNRERLLRLLRRDRGH